MDYKRLFGEAAVQFERALELYKNDPKQDNSVKGNILFRLGWALIRSRKDINRGIQALQEANEFLSENIDIKIKLSQILFQEK